MAAKPTKRRAARKPDSADAGPGASDGKSLSAEEEALLWRRLAEGEVLRAQATSARRSRLREAGLDWLVTFVAIYLAARPYFGGMPLIAISPAVPFASAVVAAFGVVVSLLASHEAIIAAGVVVAAKSQIERVNAAARRRGVRLDGRPPGE